MKKLLLILISTPSFVFAQGARIQPGGVPTPVPVFDPNVISNVTASIAIPVVNDLFYNQFTNFFKSQISDTKQPFANVINVKQSPYNAKGDGIADDWLAIQSAITDACLSTNNTPVSVYIPVGEYRITNTLVLTAQTNKSVTTTGNTSISELFGDGARRTILRFTITNANGLEFRVVTNDPRVLSNFKVRDLGIMGPALTGNTNVSGNGYFFGFSPDLPYAGSTVGWHDSIERCLLQGWGKGLCITNTVFFTAKDCNFYSNVVCSILLAHADTTVIQNCNLGFPTVQSNDVAAIWIARDKSAVGGAGVLGIGGECGSAVCYVKNDGATFRQIGGNFERNMSMLIASNFCYNTFDGCTIQQQYTNAVFVLINGAANTFYASGISGIDGITNMFNQIPGPDITGELPIRHNLNANTTNGWFNGSLRFYRSVYFQTPRWKEDFQLANMTVLNATALTPLVTSPSPFFSSDGLKINNTTGQLWVHLPSGLGNNYSLGNFETVRWTMLIQGDVGCTNPTVTLTTLVNRKNGSGDVTDYSPSFNIPGITNAALKVFQWTNAWNATSYESQRYLRLQLATTNQLYIIGLSGETIDY